MHFYTRVYMHDGDWYACVVDTSNTGAAEYIARKDYQHQGYDVESVEAELFNTFEHGDPQDYEILT